MTALSPNEQGRKRKLSIKRRMQSHENQPHEGGFKSRVMGKKHGRMYEDS